MGLFSKRNRNDTEAVPVSPLPAGGGVGFTLNDPQSLVTLYDETGAPVQVLPQHQARYMAQGMRLEPFDLSNLYAEVPGLLSAFSAALGAFRAGVERDGFIDTSDAADKAVAEFSLKRLNEVYRQITQTIDAKYPVRQADPVLMKSPDGREVAVDPNQYQLMKTKGYRKVGL